MLTLDNGTQTIRWVGSRKLDSKTFLKAPKLRPTRIEAGSLGEGLPKRDLRVSPQHRMMLHSVIAERMFGQKEVFLPAHKLLGLPGITIDTEAQRVEYFHILLDRHEVILAEGAPTESLFTGPEAMKSIGSMARLEVLALLPEIGTQGYIPTLARLVPEKGRLMKQLTSLHLKNKKPLISSSYNGLSHFEHCDAA